MRHTAQRRPALEMIDEMAGLGGWVVASPVTGCGDAGAGGGAPVVVAAAGYANALFRGEVAARGRAVRGGGQGAVSARPRDTGPEVMACSGMGRPSVPRYRTALVSLSQLAVAHADQIQPVTWR